MRWLAATVSFLTVSIAIQLMPSSPVFAASYNTSSTGCNGSFCVSYSQPTPGTPTVTPTNTPGTPSTPSTPGTPGVPGKPPPGCKGIWAHYSGIEHLIAWCSGNGAAQNILFFTTHKPSCHVGICAAVVPVPGTVGSPGTPGTPPISKSPYSGIPTALLAVFDSLNVPTPRIAGLIPSPDPWTYTLYPTQVSIAPSSLPPTLTSSSTTSQTTQVDTTWNAQKNAWNTKPVTTSLTATITAKLMGYYWEPQAGTVNGYPNVKVPNNETPGNTPGSVVCPPSQNNLNMQLSNNYFNPNYCMVQFIQPSTKSGFYLRAYGQYQGFGQITENGTVVWSGNLGYRWSNVPASVQVPVAVLEAVNCTTATCANAGLAPINFNWIPYGPERP